MLLQARLVHAEPGNRVVELSAQWNGELLGTALGEGSTAEEAEDRALRRLESRLRDRLLPSAPEPVAPRSESDPTRAAQPAAAPVRVEPPAPAPASAEPPPGPLLPETPEAPEGLEDPEDWSAELAQIDLELRRLGWGREQEGLYLERVFGHPSRSRLTRYSDLKALLKALNALQDGSDPSLAPVPLRRSELLAQSDVLMSQLGWDAVRGKRFLEANLQVSSRQQLSDVQLLQFNMLLEEQVLSLTP